MIGVAVGIVVRAGIGIDDVRIVVAIGNNIGIAVEGKERCQRFDPFNDVPAQQHPALGGEIFGNEQPRSVGFVSNDELAPQVGQRNSTLSFVDRLGIRLPLWKVEFLFRRADVNPVAGKGSVVYRALRYREVALGRQGNVVRPQHGISPCCPFR
jgi:hypothetical protein